MNEIAWTLIIFGVFAIGFGVGGLVEQFLANRQARPASPATPARPESDWTALEEAYWGPGGMPAPDPWDQMEVMIAMDERRRATIH